MGRLVMMPQPAHKTVSSGFPCRSFCETGIFSSPPHKRQGSSVCLLCSHVICARKMPACHSPCQYIAGGKEKSGQGSIVIGHQKRGGGSHFFILPLILAVLRLPLVGRCGSAAPTDRRRRSCGQNTRAPLERIGAARPQRPTEVKNQDSRFERQDKKQLHLLLPFKIQHSTFKISSPFHLRATLRPWRLGGESFLERIGAARPQRPTFQNLEQDAPRTDWDRMSQLR